MKTVLREIMEQSHILDGDLLLKLSGSRSYYRPQRSWGKVIFSEACVKNSVHRGGVCGRGGVCVAGAGHVWQGGRAWQGGVHGGGGSTWQILRDTVNERMVRILLECILVFDFEVVSFNSQMHTNLSLVACLGKNIINFVSQFNLKYV